MPDGGIYDVWATCPDVSDAGPAVELDGGWYLPNPRGPHLACKLAGCESYVSSFQAPPVSSLTLILTLAALVVGASLGVYLGFDWFHR